MVREEGAREGAFLFGRLPIYCILMKTLGKIFGTEAKVRIMRLFLFNPDRMWEVEEIGLRTKTEKRDLKRELEGLLYAGLIKKVSFTKEINDEKVKVKGLGLNTDFPYLNQFQGLLADTLLLSDKDLVERLSIAGKIRLVVVAGIFIQKWDSRVDLLIVGDRIKDDVLKRVVEKIESEVGRELSFAVFSTADFQYRLGVGDKLIRDVLDFSHKVIHDRFGL